jgi:hypothetical protein
MGYRQSARQPDLFDRRSDPDGPEYLMADGPAPPDFMDKVRRELADTLALVGGAETLPWKDLTAMTLAELRFRSMAGWLSRSEANALRASFKTEMLRLYEAYDKAYLAERAEEDGTEPIE